jgi:hypothetical protein
MAEAILEPIHGVSLKDYVAMTKKMTEGVDSALVWKAMGIDSAVWDELNTLWPQRLAEDSSFEISKLWGRYFADETPHPKLAGLKAAISPKGQENLERIKNDRYFYEELSGARGAAYEYGLDGAQWILDQFGINLADFQTVAMQHMEARNAGTESEEDTLRYLEYQTEKKEEYAKKFAAAQGGNVADDIEF